MSVVRAVRGNDDDAALWLAVPQPRQPEPESARPAAGPGPDGHGAGAGWGPDQSVSTRRVRQVQVREVRSDAGRDYQLGAREERSQLRVLRSGGGQRTVRSSAVRTSRVRTTSPYPRPVPGGGRSAPVAPAASRVTRPMAGPWRVRSPADLGPAPIRLTHRGRVVVAALAVLGVVAVITLVWIGAAGGVSAASHQPASGAAAGYRGLTEVTVQPGQTLWGIAQRAEPSADPRAVIQQILQFNSMSSPVVQPGQQIWVPKG